MKDLENEIESCMERAKQLEKADDKYMEIIKCLQKENGIYKAREKNFMCALLLSWFHYKKIKNSRRFETV
jgi:hypothetical protein